MWTQAGHISDSVVNLGSVRIEAADLLFNGSATVLFWSSPHSKSIHRYVVDAALLDVIILRLLRSRLPIPSTTKKIRPRLGRIRLVNLLISFLTN